MIARRYVMGTILTVELKGSGDLSRTMNSLLAVFQDLEERLSIFRPDSELSRINKAAGTQPVFVEKETFEILEQALHFARLTEGAFDPTAQAWRKGSYRDVLLNPDDRTVFLPRAGMRLNLGGIGKGYALDRAARCAESDFQVENLVMNFGGQLLFWNRKESFPMEKVAIEDPQAPGHILETFSVNTNCSISTSSNAERAGHLLDPRSGKPAQGSVSATVTARTGTEAEALSTALFVLGREGLSLLGKFNGARAYLFEGVCA